MVRANLLWVLLVWSCTPQTQPDLNSALKELTGTWRASGDSSLALTFTRACCGSRPTLEGSLRHGDKRVALDRLSYANIYPVQKPDSSTVYTFEVFLTSPLDPICTIDGFVQDKAGKKEFAQPVMPDSAVLSLTISAKGAKDCDSLWEPMIFEKAP